MVIDCILFYGGVDLDLLRIRMVEHSEFVDIFVISEIGTDFQGVKKRVYKEEIYELAESLGVKIWWSCSYVWGNDCETPFKKAEYWRRCLKSTLSSGEDSGEFGEIFTPYIKDTDTIIFSDLDEILNAKKWNYTPDMGLMAVETRLYYYYVNLSANAMWQNGFVAPYGFIKDKDITTLRYNYSRRKYNTGLLRDAGWHFAWLGGKEVIKDKYRNFGQAEGWNPALKSDDYIDHILKDRILFTTGHELELVPIDGSYPDELRFNAGKYLPFIYDIEK